MKRTLTLLFIIAVSLAGCNLQNSPPEPTSAAQVPTPAAGPTGSPPEPTATPTPVYVAAVNGEGITDESYQANLAQIQAAQVETGIELATPEEAATRVMDYLVDRLLLAQAARSDGFSVDDALLDERINNLVDQLGGQDALSAWLLENGYSSAGFRMELKLEIESAWMRDQITSAVPTSAEQIEARQVFFFEAFSAARVYNQLENDVPFQQIVDNNDPRQLGYLGWFPRGYLLWPQIEDAVFALQPGQYTAVIETEIGFHIVEVLDRQADRPLTEDARLTLQGTALADWLAAARGQSQIEIYAP